MLSKTDSFASFSVKDPAKARTFFENVLGLKVKEGTEPGILELGLPGGTKAMVYPKDNHEAATYTVLNFLVPDIEKAVDELTKSGVKMEIYDTKDLKTDARGIMRGNGPTIAWFKDPSGNIMSVVEKK